ncbi:MAG: hypothetical protein JNL79_04425 [Myxococcales bacterium]|nr:hypothetical protein [Myxococcales bacterium]
MAWVGSAAVAGCGGGDTAIDETDTGTDDGGSDGTADGGDSGVDSGSDTGSDTTVDDTSTADSGGDGTATDSSGDTTATDSTATDSTATDGTTDGTATDSGATDSGATDSTAADSTAADSASDAADTAEAPAVPTITNVTISAPTGYTDRQVRQGLGVITLAVTGTNLTGATTATMTGGVTCTVAASTATTATLTCNVPHGEVVGLKNLTVNTPSGSASFAGALDVTRITVLGTTGNDTTGVGTTSRPFRSVSAGLAVAAAGASAGDTVFVRSMGDGLASTTARYNTANIPTQTWATAGGTANVSAGITVEGESGAGIVRPVLEGGAANVAFKLTGGAVLKNLIVRNFGNSVLASTGTTAITDVELSAANGGAGYSTDRHIVVSGGTLTLASTAGTLPGTTRPTCAIDGANNELIRITGAPTVAITGCLLRGSNEYAINTTDGAFALTLLNDLVSNNGNFGTGAAADGGVQVNGGTTTVTTSLIQENYGFGIRAYGTASVTVSSSTLSGNGQGVGNVTTTGYTPVTGNNGIDFLGNGRLVVGRVTGSVLDTQITKNGFSGIAIHTAPGGATSTPTVSIQGVTMTGNGTTAPELFIDTAASVTGRNLSITSGTGPAVQVGSVADPQNNPAVTALLPSKLDFGTSAATGGNTLLTSAGSLAILDRRGAIASATGAVFTVCGTSMNGATLSVGTTVVGLVTSGFSYSVRHTFQRLGCP